MGSVQFMEYEGKQMLLLDFSNCKPEEIMQLIGESKKIIQKQLRNSVLTITYVKDAVFNSEVIDAMKDFALSNKDYVRAGCIVGLSGLQKTIYTVVMKFSGRNLPIFDTLEEAKKWLVKN